MLMGIIYQQITSLKIYSTDCIIYIISIDHEDETRHVNQITTKKLELKNIEIKK